MACRRSGVQFSLAPQDRGRPVLAESASRVALVVCARLAPRLAGASPPAPPLVVGWGSWVGRAGSLLSFVLGLRLAWRGLRHPRPLWWWAEVVRGVSGWRDGGHGAVPVAGRHSFSADLLG